MAAVNHAYEFTWFSIGAYGGESDGGILSKTEFGMDLENDQLNIPKELLTLPGSNTKVPYFFIGDDAFALKKNFMKPYQSQNLSEVERIYNYRISRARRCVESAFGILAMRWRILERPIGLNPETIDNLIKTSICLHNFLSSMNDTNSDIEAFKEKQKQKDCDEVCLGNEIECEPEATVIRQLLTNYFISSQGEVPWQYERVRRGDQPTGV